MFYGAVLDEFCQQQMPQLGVLRGFVGPGLPRLVPERASDAGLERPLENVLESIVFLCEPLFRDAPFCFAGL